MKKEGWQTTCKNVAKNLRVIASWLDQEAHTSKSLEELNLGWFKNVSVDVKRRLDEFVQKIEKERGT